MEMAFCRKDLSGGERLRVAPVLDDSGYKKSGVACSLPSTFCRLDDQSAKHIDL